MVKYVLLEANDSRWSRHQKARDGFEGRFIEKEAKLPHNHRVPTGSGKIEAVGKVGLVQAHRQRDVERFSVSVLRTDETSTHAEEPGGNANAASGDR